ncbi:mRNA interferase HigB [Duganella sp. 3397]|uniref:type II toxin-antitoxin system HigB family toxin n=1 Tax=Duganella sp. 3397 TaxID=2817732 RepID=UPI0028619C2D|nr:type II toxin-antitoxin system HigB family toxin [Duganella sp. 3397]MDR7050551.1 mRNA interferase HigB [Duganella sp. 3397]
MRLLSTKVLKEFCVSHPDARSAIRKWGQTMIDAQPLNFSDLRTFSRSADYVPPFTVFNLGGNKFRLIAIVHYASGTVFIRDVFTHREYDKWTKRYQQGKVRE